MYMYAKRQSLCPVDETSLKEQVRGYLTAKSTLSLASDTNAYISVPDLLSFNNTQGKNIKVFFAKFPTSFTDCDNSSTKNSVRE